MAGFSRHCADAWTTIPTAASAAIDRSGPACSIATDRFSEDALSSNHPGPAPVMLSGVMKKLHRPVYEARIRELVSQIARWLKPGDRVLDVGCGYGTLGRAILDSPHCPAGVSVRGLERVKRGGEAIEVDGYDGQKLPYDDRSFDVVIIADVMHHEPDPDRLIEQCVRVSRRFVIIKDHKVDGLLAQQRISLIDWAANAPYGVPCLYQYNTAKAWAESHKRHRLTPEFELQSMNLYPHGFNLLFGRKLQYFAVLRVPEQQSITS
jgi:ubiquinone/menaquinone biosynthesis C-methylase UbiE